MNLSKWIFQSTPPARGATTGDAHANRDVWNFNPRPPRGGRLPDVLRDVGVVEFQSTPPARGATAPPAPPTVLALDFNPRPPRGGRHQRTRQLVVANGFQSTPPARGATAALPEGFQPQFRFQSTPPARGATLASLIIKATLHISIHAPREGGDFT